MSGDGTEYDSYTMAETQAHIIAQTRRLIECSDKKQLVGLVHHIDSFSLEEPPSSDTTLMLALLRQSAISAWARPAVAAKRSV
jgi:hypothetical protein